MTIATVGHMARDMHVGSNSPHSSDELSDISKPLLLSSIVATGYITSDDCCYCWARGTHVIATSPHSSDGRFDTCCPSPLAPTVTTG
jgi:hypothetical protein